MAVDRQNTIREYHRKGDGSTVPGHPGLPSQSTVPQEATVFEDAMKTVPGFPGIAPDSAAVAQVSTEVKGILNRLQQPPVVVPNKQDTLGKRHVGDIQHVANAKPTQGGMPVRIPTGDITQFAEAKSDAGDALVTQQVVTEAAAAVEQAEVIDLGRKLDERRAQLGDLLTIVSTIKSDDDRLDVLRAAQNIASEYTTDECVAIINDFQLVADSVELQDALIVGGSVLRDVSGKTASLYTTTIILGQGGMGVVKDGFLLKEGRFLSAAIKEPIALVIDPTLDRQAQIDVYENRKAGYMIEAWNAEEYLADPIKNVVEVLFVSESGPQGELPVIVYKKITNREGKSVDLYTVAEMDAVAPSAKLLAFTAAVDGLARLHSQGKVHLDIKPENMVLDENGEGVIIDPASMFSVLDTIDIIEVANFPVPLIQKTWESADGNNTMSLGYTPQLVDLHLVKQGRDQGKSLAIADRLALGRSLAYFLEVAKLTIADDIVAAYPDAKPYLQERLNLSPDQYPPSSLIALLDLARELQDITAEKPLRPLEQIAQEMRFLAEQAKDDLDHWHKLDLWQDHMSQITTL